MQFVGHGLRVGPELCVEAEIAHQRPMEEVDDDQVDRDVAALELAGGLKQLLLVPVAQLALPEAQAPLRHDGRVAGGVGVLALDLRRGVAGGDPVVDLVAGRCLPLRAGFGERGAADRRIVPQEAVALRGDDERHRHLRVAVSQFQGRALEVHDGLLVFAHAVQVFMRVGVECDRGAGSAAGQRLVFARLEPQRAAVVGLLEQHSAVGVGERELAAAVPTGHARGHGDASVGQGGLGAVIGDDDGRCGGVGGRRQQRPVGVGDRLHEAGPDADAVRAPWFDADGFAVADPGQGAVGGGEWRGDGHGSSFAVLGGMRPRVYAVGAMLLRRDARDAFPVVT